MRTQIDIARDYIQEHLVECCREILELQTTSILPSGHVRKAAEILRPLVLFNHLSVAESMVKNAALQRIASDAPRCNV